MSIKNKYIRKIEETVERQKKGEYLFVPCSIPYFNKDFSGISKNDITIFTAGTSQGKTSFFKLVMFDAIKNAIKLNLKIKFLLFLLEESEEKFVHSIIGYLLYDKYKIRYNTIEFCGRKVNDKGDNIILSDDIVELIKGLDDEVELYLSYMVIHTNIISPSIIYKTVKKYCRPLIQYYNKDKKLTIEDIENQKEFTHFEESEEIVVVATDHISLQSENNELIFETIDKMRFYSKMYMEKILHCHVMWIQQNSKASGSLEAIKNELYFASNTNLSDNKSTASDAYNIISITCPNLYDVKKWRGYDIEKLKSGLSIVTMTKARYGRVNIKLPFFWDGKTGHYELLPKKDEEDFEEKMEKYYEMVRNFYK